jgi:pimeloyl-ACP methyl ester carboxylesterase
MPTVPRPDGVEIHWEERGEGPLVVIAGYWSMFPPIFDGLMEELEDDHRVVLYHDRGTGRSTRRGPYDMDTSAADLAAVIEAAGPPAVVLCSGDGANRTVRVAAARPDLIQAMVCVGGAPVGRKTFTDSDVMAASDAVVGALMSQVETDYRGALRGVLTATNPQMSEEELRERVSAQSEHSPHEAAVARMRAWIDDDPADEARAVGDRLWIGVSENLGGGWFPSGADLARRVRKGLPEAHVVELADGYVSRPDETASIIRRVIAKQGALGRTE